MIDDGERPELMERLTELRNLQTRYGDLRGLIYQIEWECSKLWEVVEAAHPGHKRKVLAERLDIPYNRDAHAKVQKLRDQQTKQR